MNISTALVYYFLVVLAGAVFVEGEQGVEHVTIDNAQKLETLSDQKRSTEQEDIGEGKRPLTCVGNDELCPHTIDYMRHVIFCSLGIMHSPPFNM